MSAEEDGQENHRNISSFAQYLEIICTFAVSEVHLITLESTEGDSSS